MKTLTASEKNQLQFCDRTELCAPQGGEVNLRVLAAGICGSDIQIWRGLNPFATYPRILGHEVVGEVVAVGAEVCDVSVGDRAILNPIQSCSDCYACRIGRPNVCQKLQVVGVHIDGGFCEWMQVPEDSLILLPKEISHTDAVMIEPMSIAMQGCWRANLNERDDLLILGAGALGRSVLRIAKNSGARIIVADLAEEKLEGLLEEGAHHVIHTAKQDLGETLRLLTDGYGPTVAVDAACFHGSLSMLLDVIGNAGRIVMMSFSKEKETLAPVQITGREIEILGSRLQSNKMPEVIDFIRNGKLPLEGLVSHVFPFSKAIEAMELAASGRGDVHKVVLDMTL